MPDIAHWRNRLAHKLANAVLRHIATADYRGIIDGAIRLGLATAARPDDRGAVEDALDAIEADARTRLDAGHAPTVAEADIDAIRRVRDLYLAGGQSDGA